MTSWKDEQLLIRFQIEQLAKNQEKQVMETQQLKLDLAVLRTKAMIVGSFGGAVLGGLVTLIVNWASK